MHLDLSRCLHVATEAARAAGRLLQERRASFSVREKARADLVTDVDEASQRCIKDMIHAAFPEHGFLGEESTAHEHQQGKQDARPLWIVDPIDGTINYVHGYPFYAVSIALALGLEIQVGILFDPSHGELFHVKRGGHAFCNETTLRTTATSQLQDALLALGFSTKPEEQDWLLTMWRHFSLKTHGLRRTGSSALNMAHVAAGRVDAFFASGVHSWDIAAGLLLVEAAGGKVTGIQGQPYDMHHQRRILATNGPLHERMVEELSQQP
jgi:myo-inositol-1(or 4)-monophosphatase